MTICRWISVCYVVVWLRLRGIEKKYLLALWKYLRVVQRQIWLEVTRSKISRIIAGQRSPINNPDPPLGATLSPQHSINTTSFHSKSPENFDKIIPRVPFLLWFKFRPVLFNRGCWSVFQVYLNICSPVRGPVVQALELETILREVSQSEKAPTMLNKCLNTISIHEIGTPMQRS